MKKPAYIAGGILIGFVFATTTGAFADSVNGLIGKKVTGEYTVVVDGKELSDKGPLIDGKANVPVRGISEAFGADVKVSGKNITITTKSSNGETSSVPTTSNKYLGQSKESLEDSLKVYKEHILKPAKEGKEVILGDIEALKGMGGGDAITKKQAILKEYDDSIAKAEAEIQQIEAALATAK